MGRFWLGFGIALAIAHPAIALDGFQPKQLEPTSDWVLDYGEEYCGLVRNFGEGEDALTLQIADWGDFGGYHITIRGEGVPRPSNAVSEVGFRVNSSLEMETVTGFPGIDGESANISFGLAVVKAGVRREREALWPEEQLWPWPVETEFERAADNWHIDYLDMEYALHTGSMNAPLEALRACRKDLYASWGLDAEAQFNLSAIALPEGNVVRDIVRKYRSSAQGSSNGVFGVFIPVRVIVGLDGQAESCTIQVQSVDPHFGEAICSELMRSYLPARDSAGNPVRSVYASPIQFYIIRR